MALSTRELYLVLRAKNEATAALNSMGRDLDKARSSAELMGAQSAKAHLQAEQAAARNAKAHAEFAQRQLESQRASAQQAVAQEQATQKMLAYNTATLEGQKATQQAQLATVQHRQAVDQNAVSLLQNAKAHNDVRIAQLQAVGASGEQTAALRAANLQLRDQINTVRDGIIARQNDINSQRQSITATQEQINRSKEHQQVARQNVLIAQDQARSYDAQISAQRQVVSNMREEINQRQGHINAIDREIGSIKKSNAEREEQNKKLRETGQSMATAGTAMAASGTIALAGIYQLTQSAVDYEKATAMTKSQVDETGVTLKQLGDIGLQVARDFGVPFESIQKGFFDIFSSMDVNVPQAESLLRAFSKAAIAGGTDIQTAGRLVISQLNAFKIPVEDVGRVLDVQFRLVQKGVGSYEEFARSLGRAQPSAVRAGQSIETLSGMMALLTRSGLTVYNATASAGRALDLFSNAKVVGRLEEMGIKARDASGHFRPLADVVLELREKFSKLDAPTRAEEMEALFKGSGNNIQARRFWDLVLATDKGAQEFKNMVNAMTDSGGTLEKKYGEMSDTLAVRNEKMKNQWKALAVEAGTALFPALEKIINGLSKLAEWFNSLSDGQQKFLAWAVVIGSVLLTAAGAILVVAGVIATLISAVGGAALAIGALIAVVAGAFIAAWIYAYTKIEWFHDAVNAYVKSIGAIFVWLKDAAVAVWNAIVDMLQGAWRDIQTIWDALKAAGRALGDSWDWIKDKASTVWNWIKDVVKSAGDFLQSVWESVKSALRTLGDAFQWLLDKVQPIWNMMKLAADIWWAAMQVMWGLVQIALKLLGAGFQWLADKVGEVWDWIKNKTSEWWNAVKALWDQTIAFIKGQFAAAWDWLSEKVTAVWNKIKDAISAAWNWIKSNVLDPIVSHLKGPLAAGWDWISDKISTVWNAIRDKSQQAWNWIKDNVFTPIQNFTTKTLPDAFNTFVNAVSSAWNRFQDVAKAPIKFVVNTVLNDGLLAGYNKIAAAFNVKPDNVHVGLPFAEGGPVWGPGGPKADMIPAMLSNGEHVLTAAEVQAMGGHNAVMKWRREALQHRALLAAGGPVGDMSRLGGVGRDVTMRRGPAGGPLDFLGDLVAAGFDMLNPSSMLEKFKGMLGNAGAGGFASAAIGAGGKIVDGVIQWVKDKVAAILPGGDANTGGPSGNSIARILQWGRMFYPGAAVSSGYRPGDPGYHGAGLAADLIGGGAAGMQTMAAGFYAMSGRLLELIHSGGPGYFVKNGARVGSSFYASEIAGHYDHVHVAANNNALMDRGGLLRPGVTNVLNGTGAAERVLSVAQTQSFDQLVRLLDAGRSQGNVNGLAPVGGYGRGGSSITINVHTNEIDPRRHAMMLGMELEKAIG